MVARVRMIFWMVRVGALSACGGGGGDAPPAGAGPTTNTNGFRVQEVQGALETIRGLRLVAPK